MVAREMPLAEILLASASNGETVDVTETEEDRTLVAVDMEPTKATATSIVGDIKIPSYFQLRHLHLECQEIECQEIECQEVEGQEIDRMS